MLEVWLKDNHAAGGQLRRVLAGLQAQVAIKTLQADPPCSAVLMHPRSRLQHRENQSEAGILHQRTGIAIAPCPTRLLLQVKRFPSPDRM
jgi:hypothetical protein